MNRNSVKIIMSPTGLESPDFTDRWHVSADKQYIVYRATGETWALVDIDALGGYVYTRANLVLGNA